MATATVIPLRKQDPALREEARTAVRLVKSIRDGDERAETEFVERYRRGLHAFLRRKVGDERASDLVQDTLFIAIEKLRSTKLDNPERLAGYVRGIANYVAKNANRKSAREPYNIDIDAVAAIPDAEPRQFQQVSAEETSAAVRQLLDTMPVERDRELLVRYYVYDQDKAEICAALDLDSLHFNRVLYRAKRRFRKLLEESGSAPNLTRG